MGDFEMIERLCDVTRVQAEIIKKQAAIIEQANITISNENELQQMRDTAAAELEIINRECN